MVRLLIVLCSLSFGAKEIILNGTAAMVGTHLLTVQDVYLFKALKKLKDAEPGAANRETGEELKKSVQLAAFEEMVFLELKSLSFSGGTNAGADVQKVISSIKAKHGKDWKQVKETFSVSESDLTERLNKQIQVEKFLKNKVDTLAQVITEAEVQKYFADNQARFRGSSLEQLRPSILLILKKQRAQAGLEEWVKFLKEKYRVQNQLEG